MLYTGVAAVSARLRAMLLNKHVKLNNNIWVTVLILRMTANSVRTELQNCDILVNSNNRQK